MLLRVFIIDNTKHVQHYLFLLRAVHKKIMSYLFQERLNGDHGKFYAFIIYIFIVASLIKCSEKNEAQVNKILKIIPFVNSSTKFFIIINLLRGVQHGRREQGERHLTSVEFYKFYYIIFKEKQLFNSQKLKYY